MTDYAAITRLLFDSTELPLDLVSICISFIEMISVSIIGTAGRKEDQNRVNFDLFIMMTDCAKYIIQHMFKLQLHQVQLVSGGAAVADHVAVVLFLDRYSEFSELIEFLPCGFDFQRIQAVDNGQAHFYNNPGRTMNQLHRTFSRYLGLVRRDDYTLNQLKRAFEKGAIFDTSHFGFHARNSPVAQSSYLIAFTWGEDLDKPKDGGSLDTWTKCTNGIKVHVPLRLLQTCVDFDQLSQQLHIIKPINNSNKAKRPKIQTVQNVQSTQSGQPNQKTIAQYF